MTQTLRNHKNTISSKTSKSQYRLFGDDFVQKNEKRLVRQHVKVFVLACVCRCLWFMLEVLMTKNENNSHAFLRKMVENIKLTKDAQCPDDAKANEVSAPFTRG